jgi:hypothetical protein
MQPVPSTTIIINACVRAAGPKAANWKMVQILGFIRAGTAADNFLTCDRTKNFLVFSLLLVKHRQ